MSLPYLELAPIVRRTITRSVETLEANHADTPALCESCWRLERDRAHANGGRLPSRLVSRPGTIGVCRCGAIAFDDRDKPVLARPRRARRVAA